MTRVGLSGGARTPVCRAGGRLRHVSALDLALAAARGALTDAAVDPAALAGLVAACALPGEPAELSLATALASRIGSGGRSVTVAGLESSGLDALATAAALVESDGAAAALAVGTESASRVPYWARGLRWEARSGGPTALDPLAEVVAAAGRRAGAAPGGRSEQDAFAARSRAAAHAAPLEAIVAVGGADVDEPASGPRDAQGLAELKPLFYRHGSVTAGSTALPADGAAAAVLVAPGEGGAGTLELLAFAPAAAEALERAEVRTDALAAVELHEGTAAEALAVAASLGLEPSIVNTAGGAIGQGHPVAASGIVMVLRLRARLARAGGGTGLVWAPGCALVAAMRS